MRLGLEKGLLLASAALLALATSAAAASRDFVIRWSSNGTASATGTMTIDDAVFLNPGDNHSNAIAWVTAFVVGIATGTALHGFRDVREALDPLFATYYAIPIFAFYPLFIVIFGLGDGPQVLIGFLLGVVAVIVTTLNGLDRVPRVLRKTAAIARLSPLETALSVTLPFCAPYLITAAKLALAYAFIGVIGSEFIMARSGMGYEIGFAFLNFDNATMYPLIVLVLLLSIVLNGALTHWEKKLLARRGLQ